jgi:hypothetical protein
MSPYRLDDRNATVVRSVARTQVPANDPSASLVAAFRVSTMVATISRFRFGQPLARGAGLVLPP